MAERLEIENQQDTDLKKQLEKVIWPLDFGTITLQLRNGRLTLLRIERTVKLD
jgi:hypothetical protein